MVISAAETVFPAGAFMTGIPRSVAARRSMLSTPTPARPTALSRGAASIISRFTWVALRTIRASARVARRVCTSVEELAPRSCSNRMQST